MDSTKLALSAALLILASLTGWADPIVIQNEYPIANFEELQWRTGWGRWADKESQTPTWTKSTDAAEGSQAIEVSFYGCKHYQGFSYSRNLVPKGCNALSFWAKIVSGNPPSQLEVKQSGRPDGGKTPMEVFLGVFSYGDPGVWKRIVVPFRSFRFNRYQDGTPADSKKELQSGKYVSFSIIGYNQNNGIVIFDDFRWIKCKPATPAQESL